MKLLVNNSTAGAFTLNRLHRFALTGTVYACMFVFGVVLLLMGSLLPSLEVNYSQAGSLGSLPLAGIFIATILVGPVLDVVGAKLVLGLALGVITAALAAMPSLRTYPTLAAAALAYGLGGGLLNTATNAVISDLHAAGRGAALNLLGFSFSLGAISAPLLMSSVGGALPPSTVLRSLASVTAVIWVLVLGLRFPPPGRAGTRITSLLRVWKNSMVWLFGALLLLESSSENCMFVWSGKAVAEVLNAGPQRANLALLALSGALGIGRLLAVLWLRWLGSWATIGLSTATTAIGAAIAYVSSEFASMLAGVALIGLGMAAVFPTALALAGDRFPAETGTVFGAIMTLALIGGMAGPRLGARLAGKGPIRVFWIPAIAAPAIAILSLVIRRAPSKSAELP